MNNRSIKNKISLMILIMLFFTMLTSCVITPTPAKDVEVIKSVYQYNTALYANDDGSDGFFVKREVGEVIGCYLVGWNEETNKIDTSMIGAGHLIFDVEDEHLKQYEINDFELLSVYIDLYYYVYFSANDKIYEYVLEYNSFLPGDFSYVNFREVNPLMDGFNRVITTPYDSVMIGKDDESILDNVDNESLINIYGSHYLYLNEENHLIYTNSSKTKPVVYPIIEEETNIVHSIMNNNYAIVLTSNNKIYKFQYSDLSIDVIDVVNPEFMISNMNNNYFAIVDEGKIKIYNYMLELISEVIPTQPISEIVGICLEYKGSIKNKKLILSLSYLTDNVLYRTVDEIKLS